MNAHKTYPHACDEHASGGGSFGTEAANDAYPPLADQAILVVNPRGKIQFSSPQAQTLVHVPDHALDGMQLATLMPQLPLRAATPGYNCAYLMFHFPPGRWHTITLSPPGGSPVSVKASFVFLASDRNAQIVIGLKSCQSDDRTEEQYRRLLAKLDCSEDAAVVTSPDGIVEYVNPAYERLSGWRLDELVGQPRRPPALTTDADTGDAGTGGGKTLRYELSRNGRPLYLDEQVRPFTDRSGHATHLISIAKDVSERIANERGLLWRANFDHLTRIANRHTVIHRLNQEISRASREDRSFTVICADMDHLKAMNDAFGHAAGDEAICAIAEHLGRCVREMDTVGRLGGDEFVVIVPGLSLALDIDMLLDKLVASVGQAQLHRSAGLRLSISAGAAVYPRDGRDAASLLHAADSAMYRAKRRGGGHHARAAEPQPALLSPDAPTNLRPKLHVVPPRMPHNVLTMRQPHPG